MQQWLSLQNIVLNTTGSAEGNMRVMTASIWRLKAGKTNRHSGEWLTSRMDERRWQGVGRVGRVGLYDVSNILFFESDGEYTDCFHGLYTYNRNLQSKLVF